MFTVTIYDVTDTKRRNTLRKKLKNFGEPVQFSGFEAILRPKQLEKMKEAIRGTIEPSEDRVRVYLLCDGCRQRTQLFGEGQLTEDRNSILL